MKWLKFCIAYKQIYGRNCISFKGKGKVQTNYMEMLIILAYVTIKISLPISVIHEPKETKNSDKFAIFGYFS